MEDFDLLTTPFRSCAELYGFFGKQSSIALYIKRIIPYIPRTFYWIVKATGLSRQQNQLSKIMSQVCTGHAEGEGYSNHVLK